MWELAGWSSEVDYVEYRGVGSSCRESDNTAHNRCPVQSTYWSLPAGERELVTWTWERVCTGSGNTSQGLADVQVTNSNHPSGYWQYTHWLHLISSLEPHVCVWSIIKQIQWANFFSLCTKAKAGNLKVNLLWFTFFLKKLMRHLVISGWKLCCDIIVVFTQKWMRPCESRVVGVIIFISTFQSLVMLERHTRGFH